MSGKYAPNWCERPGNEEWRAGYAGDRGRIEAREHKLLGEVTADLEADYEAHFGRRLNRAYLHGEFPDTQLVAIITHSEFPRMRFGFTRWIWDDSDESTMLSVKIGEDAQPEMLERAVQAFQGDLSEVIWIYPAPWSGGDAPAATSGG